MSWGGLDQILKMKYNHGIQRTNGFWNLLMNIVLSPLSENLVLEKVWVKFFFHYCDPNVISDASHILMNVELISTGQVCTRFDTRLTRKWIKIIDQIFRWRKSHFSGSKIDKRFLDTDRIGKENQFRFVSSVLPLITIYHNNLSRVLVTWWPLYNNLQQMMNSTVIQYTKKAKRKMLLSIYFFYQYVIYVFWSNRLPLWILNWIDGSGKLEKITLRPRFGIITCQYRSGIPPYT